MKKYNGLFITFEGIESCGKSTQSRLLLEFLQENGKKCHLTREPGGTKISEQIREILLNPQNKEMLPETEMLLYNSSRSQHTGELIIPLLKEGYTVISDRFFDSTIAYQGAARNINRKIIDRITNYATFGLKPDLTFLVDVSVRTSRQRLAEFKPDRIENENEEFHKKVRQGFLELAEEEISRYKIIDGERKIENIHQEIKNIVKSYINLGDL